MKTIITLIRCPDAARLINRITGFISEAGGNIVHLEEWVDKGARPGKNRVKPVFLMRIVSEHDDADAPLIHSIQEGVSLLSGGKVETHDTADKFRVAFLASHERHCLDEVVMAYRRGELDFEPVLIGSNYLDLREAVTRDCHGWKFKYFPVGSGGRMEQGDQIIAALERKKVDILVLAKYMSILSPSFIKRFPNTVNVHHSFLPAFKGSRPYEQAYRRGVKSIGATSHFITEHLDRGLSSPRCKPMLPDTPLTR